MTSCRVLALICLLPIFGGCTIMLNPDNGGASFPSNSLQSAPVSNPVLAASEPEVPSANDPPATGANNVSLPPIVGLRPPPISIAEPPKASTPPVRQIWRPTKPVQVCRECIRHAPPKANEPVRQ